MSIIDDQAAASGALAELLHRFGIGCRGRCSAASGFHFIHADRLREAGVSVVRRSPVEDPGDHYVRTGTPA